MENNTLSRRMFLVGTTATGAMLIAGRGQAALTTEQARALIDNVVGDITSVINSGKSEQRMYGDFERIFWKYGDVPTISRSTLGPAARSASRSQLDAFAKAFGGYLSRKYGKRFREFIGGKIEVQSARPLKSFYEVKTVALLQGEAPFDLTFLVSDRSGKNLFFDMLIEGISLLKAERTEIGAMLDSRRGNLDRLINDLKTMG
ncbi:MAG: ABC transporter substrate-binding protein [Rhodobacteraceae bacterium]|nr:ABC transporter substrate-binding protein [Paracoccaceae bacterium]